MKTSDQINELSAAMAKAQGKFPEIVKDKKVEVKNKEGKYLYSYFYAELSTIVSAVRPALAESGLSIAQGMSGDGNYCVTRILHSSGQWIETQYPFVAKESDMQALGGGFTFARRYAISALLGIATETDDDASKVAGKNAEISGGPNSPAQKPNPPAQPGFVTIEALVKYEDRELAKKSGFTFGNGKKWLKQVPREELNKNSYPFEIRAL